MNPQPNTQEATILAMLRHSTINLRDPTLPLSRIQIYAAVRRLRSKGYRIYAAGNQLTLLSDPTVLPD